MQILRRLYKSVITKSAEYAISKFIHCFVNTVHALLLKVMFVSLSAFDAKL